MWNVVSVFFGSQSKLPFQIILKPEFYIQPNDHEAYGKMKTLSYTEGVKNIYLLYIKRNTHRHTAT